MIATPEELEKEWLVTYETRLGMSCEDRNPTESQKWGVRQESDQHIAELLQPKSAEDALKTSEFVKQHMAQFRREQGWV